MKRIVAGDVNGRHDLHRAKSLAHRPDSGCYCAIPHTTGRSRTLLFKGMTANIALSAHQATEALTQKTRGAPDQHIAPLQYLGRQLSRRSRGTINTIVPAYLLRLMASAS